MSITDFIDNEDNGSPIKFALFYSNSRLRFCVPYTDTDKTYLNEMLQKNTVPMFRGAYGEWIKLEEDTEYLTYIADYSKIRPKVPRDELSFDWDIEHVADEIWEYDSSIELDGEYIDLFDTDFSKITGINQQNLRSLTSLEFCDWLEREGILYNNGVKKICEGYDKRKDEDYISMFGYFRIGYHEGVAEAVDFLDELDIHFKPHTRSEHYVGPYKAWYLEPKRYLSPNEDVDEAMDALLPLDRMIPSRVVLSTPYTVLKRETRELEIDKDVYSRINNNLVVDITNAELHPECDFDVIDEDARTVELAEYLGSDESYEIPFCTLLSEDSAIYHIVSISGYAFAQIDTLKSVVIPNTIEEIGDEAFYCCTNLANVELSEGLETIGEGAFAECDSLHEVIIPKTVREIGEEAFNTEMNILLKCPKSALSKDSISDRCNVIIEGENKTKPSSKKSSPIKKFCKSLDDTEREYVLLICDDEDASDIIRLSGKSESIIKHKINKKAFDALDEDEGIFDDDGNIFEEYREELRNIISKM